MSSGRSPAARARSARHSWRRHPRRKPEDKGFHHASSATTVSATPAPKSAGPGSATPSHDALAAAGAPSKTDAVSATASASRSNSGAVPSSPANAPKASSGSAKGSSTKKPASKSTTTTSHPTASTTPQLGSSEASSHTAITAGAVAGAVVVIALLAFFIRRYFVMRRSAGTVRRSQYEKATPATKENRSQLLPLLSEKKPIPAQGSDDAPFSPMSPPTPARPASVYSATPSSIAPSALLSPMVKPQSPLNVPLSRPSVNLQPPMSPLREVCIARRNFVGTMPDELAITVGEPLSIVATYDDGWAMCSNAYGQHGVVPVDCLAHESDARPDVHDQDGGAWRLSRRASSLYASAPAGTY